MGCHRLLQCMKVKRESELAQSCLTLSDPMDCSPPGSSVHEAFQATVLEWGAIASSHGNCRVMLCTFRDFLYKARIFSTGMCSPCSHFQRMRLPEAPPSPVLTAGKLVGVSVTSSVLHIFSDDSNSRTFSDVLLISVCSSVLSLFKVSALFSVALTVTHAFVHFKELFCI